MELECAKSKNQQIPAGRMAKFINRVSPGTMKKAGIVFDPGFVEFCR
jgi:hypothetical protein